MGRIGSTVSGRFLGWLFVAVSAVLLAGAVAWRSQAGEAAVLRADPESILGNPDLRARALPGGRSVYIAHCAACHGAAGKGNQAWGVPDLTDEDRLYGDGKVAEIEEIARHGIRSGDKRGWNLAAMPAYASAVPYKAEPLPPQTPAQIEELTQYLLSFTGRATDEAAAKRGKVAYEAAGCWDCHSHDAGGDRAIGAPTLTDEVWLYGGSAAAIRRTLTHGRAGISPAYGGVLTAAQLREVAVYVASLAPAPSVEDTR